MPGSEQPRSESAARTQIARDAFWAAAQLGPGLIEIDRQECMELLTAKAVGRLAYVVDNGARILPFNYIVAEDSVILRTVPDGEVYHHALSSICAFEVDETDEFFQSGWSVVVVGRLELATDEDFARMLYGKMPEPWVGGNRYMFVRLRCDQISGRRAIGLGR